MQKKLFALCLTFAACENADMNLGITIQGAELNELNEAELSLFVNVGGEQRNFSVQSATFVIDSARLLGSDEELLFDSQKVVKVEVDSFLLLSNSKAALFNGEIRRGSFDGVEVNLGLLRPTPEQPTELIGRSILIEGLVDNDNNGVVEAPLAIALPVSQSLTFSQQLKVINDIPRRLSCDFSEPAQDVSLDLQSLLLGLDVSLAQPDATGRLVLTEVELGLEAPNALVNSANSFVLEQTTLGPIFCF